MAQDPDNPEATDADLAEMRPARDALPPALEPASVLRGGRPKAEVRKVPVAIRLDPPIVDAFEATGPGWQTRMNEALAEAASTLMVARRLA
nr:BrnA antitoxin family protein [Methylobacterium sp.]